MENVKRLTILIVTSVIFFGGVVQTFADETSLPIPASIVTVVSVPGLSFADLHAAHASSLPNIRHMMEQGSVAAMNIRTSRRSLGDTYAAIGASSHSEGRIVQAEQPGRPGADGSAVDRYARFRGYMPFEGEVMIPQVWHNENERSGVRLLGQMLNKYGIGTAVYGNADLGTETARYAPLMLADEEGIVRYGNIGDGTLIVDYERAFGMRTNYEALFGAWKHTDGPAVVVLELGDLYRLYEQQSDYRKEAFDYRKLEVLKEIDGLLGAIRNELTERHGALWLMSPLVSREAWVERSRLAPLFKLDADAVSSLLYSPTTRRNGIVSMYDIAPSLLAEFGIASPPEMLGQPLSAKPQPNALAMLERQYDKIITVYKLRPELLYPFVTYQVIILLVALLTLVLQLSFWRSLIRFALLTLLNAPIALLVLSIPTMYGLEVVPLVVIFTILLLILAAICMSLPILKGMAVAAGITTVGILADGFFGFTLMKSSILGYDPMIGARYYGIGNEYMGVWVGSALLLVFVILQMAQHASKWWITVIKLASVALFACIFIILALPGFGTNAGGALTAGVAFGIAVLRMFAKNPTKVVHARKIVIVGAIMLLGAFLLLWLLNATVNVQSHIGRAMDLVYAGKFDEVLAIIGRKLTMNAHLIGVSVWTKALLSSLVVVAVIVLKPGKIFIHWQGRYPYMMYGFSANAAGGIVALAANDSGIVAASTMIVFMVVPMLLIRSGELEDGYDSVSSPHVS